ncbi:MAG TPA: M3 family metallopeptidase [Jatrophihabitantaceae bacterium]|jgi:thimet oligopeptidase|nr:M3 family metallopeptidase [Jatrophihabitantaceae bacterium]
MTDPVALPGSDESWTDWLTARIDTALDTVRRVLAELKDGTARGTAEVLALWNETDLALDDAESLVSVFAEVHPDEAVRTLAEARAQEVSRLDTDRGLDRELYEVIAATEDFGDDEARRLRRRVLREFRRSGVDRDDDVRTRVREIADRLTVLSQDFGRAIRDDVRSIKIRPEQLAGLPQDFIDAHPAGGDGLVTITTDYPDIIPFRTFAHDAAAREALVIEFFNRAWPQNDAVLAEMLALRAELAGLLGYPSWPDYDAEVKMIGTGDAIIEFIDKITAASAGSAQRDFDVLLARRQRDDPEATTLSRADSVYYEELVRREVFDVDAQEVRRYFDFQRVRGGLLDTTARLFGVEYRPRTDVAVWHDEVTAYDVLADGAQIGRIYLDLHPREGKFKHAAQFTIASGLAGRQLPEGVLVCNFSRALMEHHDVVTLFHEFGHLVHHVLAGSQRWARFSGVATEWDFVEAPSQMLEEWAWDADVLQGFALDDGGNPIPRDLVARMREAEEFGKGYLVRTQMFYAALSYLVHHDRPADLTAAVRDAQRNYDMFAYLDGTHYQTSFGHLAGYTSAYYTYMWSKVIAKDMFSAFDDADLFEPSIAHRYRDEVLARGGSADAADLVATFLGRPYSFESFEQWLDTAPRAGG